MSDYTLDEWVDKHQPDGGVDYSLRLFSERFEGSTSGEIDYSADATAPITKAQLRTGACQYWMNGLYPVCKKWDASTLMCTATPVPGQKEEDYTYPSGYGVGKCDMLGRRDWCDQYEPSKEVDLEEFVCVAICPERSGLGKQEEVAELGLCYRALLPSEVEGYNADEETGVGRCDGWGMGRGEVKESYINIEDLYKDLPVCKFYRPNQMGFGALQPRPFHGSSSPGRPFDTKVNWIPKTIKEMYDGSAADPMLAMAIRLPFIFDVYNSRAMYQTCGHWLSTDGKPSFFEVTTYGTDATSFYIDLDNPMACMCNDPRSDPFKTIKEPWPPDVPLTLASIWAEYGGIVCNGAKPECPCYTGKWLYCTDEKMRSGMTITADQLFELRFWASNWANQAEYDAYYLAKPGPTVEGAADISTSDIYTFTEWEVLDASDPNKSIMRGFKHHMCMPAPPNKLEFIPSYYIEKTPKKYPALNKFTGTNDVVFPTLVRELEDPLEFLPDINIIFPYFRDNPWDALPCDDSDSTIYSLNTNLMTDQYVSVIGQAVFFKKVYVINSNLSYVFHNSKAKNLMDSVDRANSIDYNKRTDFDTALKEAIDSCLKENDGIYNSVAGGNGFFRVDTKLLINKVNLLYIICEYEDSKYIFRKLEVRSKYWAALIEQNSAVQPKLDTNEVYTNNFPSYYSPKLNITGNVNTLRGYVQDIFSVYSFKQYSYTGDELSYYSYCINEYSVEDIIDNWTRVGSTGYIFAEIENSDISYLWDFEVTRAQITSRITEEVVELEVVYPSSSSSDRRTIPPSAVLLAPKETGVIRDFFNSDWYLYVEYKYQRLESKLVNPVSPVGISLVNSPYIVNFERTDEYKDGISNKSFSITDFGGLTSRGSIKVMALICDENGVVQTAAATKLVVQGQRLGCSNVDIFYDYNVEATRYVLEPSTGFTIYIDEDRILDKVSHGKTPACGDHDCYGMPCIGPMWYPYDRCNTMYYNVYPAVASCTLRITEGDSAVGAMGLGGWRYCQPEIYKPYVDPGGNWAAVCGSQFTYMYSAARNDNEIRFVGTAKRKAKVDEWTYSFLGWELPPFGNSGRGYVERFISRDFINFYDMSVWPPDTKSAFMPMVFDKEDLFQDLNAFNKPFETTEPSDPFYCFSLLSCYTSNLLNEYISEDRYRFDDIINVIYHGSSMYPQPFYGPGPLHHVARYGFKDNAIIWAWPEYWKDIEIVGERKLYFLDIERPEYYFDYYKNEHRLITDEGEHYITFEPPKGTSTSDDSDDPTPPTYPSIRLDNGEKRYFNIIYDSYYNTQVDWMDETAAGQIDSSGGNSIYELANNGIDSNGPTGSNEPQWLHDFNTIFDSNAAPDTVEERYAYVRPDVVKGFIMGGYNRGLIANITRDRLKYLPMDITEDVNASTFNTSLDVVTAIFEISDYGTSPVTVTIEGIWGVGVIKEDGSIGGSNDGVIGTYSKPDVSMKEIIDQEEQTFNYAGTSGSEVALEAGENVLTAFVLSIDLDRTPYRFVGNSNIFTVTLTAKEGEVLDISNITIDTGHYAERTETINVWERKYKVGLTDELIKNADGPNSETYRTPPAEMEISGQYFPLDTEVDEFQYGGQVLSKLNMVSFTNLRTEDEEIPITRETIKEVEATEQRLLYEAAYNTESYDEIGYTGITPPLISGWLEELGLPIDSLKPSVLILSHYKVEWNQNEIANSLKQNAELFRPGGHYFKWIDGVTEARCYIFGAVEQVHRVAFYHHLHGGSPELDINVANVWLARSTYLEKIDKGLHF